MFKKEITVEEGLFIIDYITTISQEIENLEDIKDKLINIHFKSNHLISDEKILDVVKSYEQILFGEIKVIINQFPELYNRFDFVYDFYYLSFDVVKMDNKLLNSGVELSIGVISKSSTY